MSHEMFNHHGEPVLPTIRSGRVIPRFTFTLEVEIELIYAFLGNTALLTQPNFNKFMDHYEKLVVVRGKLWYVIRYFDLKSPGFVEEPITQSFVPLRF
jgi:phenylalanine-4-hydroxylase